MDRHKTSVFSDYEPMENSSVTSKQLENWLKQNTDSIHSPKFGTQWTLMMSHSSSRFENEEVSFSKQEPYDVSNNENNSLMSNKSKASKNKSYVNAMQALQKKVKSLEEENQLIKRSMKKVSEEKSRSISESFAIEEQLRSRIEILEPKTHKIDELLVENKKLRETKEEKVRRLKTLERINQENKGRNEELIKQVEKIKNENENLKNQLERQNGKVQNLQHELETLFEKNKLLEEMKEKSTATLFDKYNKSIEYIQELEKENGRLKNEIQTMRKGYEVKILSTQQNYQSQIQNYRIQLQKLKESYQKQEEEIEVKIKEKQYFKHAYEKRDEEFVLLAKSQYHKESVYIHESKEKSKSQSKDDSGEKKQKKSQSIQLPQSLLPQKKKKVTDQYQSQMDLDLDQSMIPTPNETKSVGKVVQKENKKNLINLSSSQKRKSNKKKQVMSLNAQEKEKKSKQSVEKHKYDSENNSFILKSCEPAIPYQDPYVIIDTEQNPATRNSYYYSTGYKPVEHKNYSFSNYQQNKGFEDFGSQKQENHRNLEKLMLMEVQKQLLDLYDEEQRLIMDSNDEGVTQNERAEYLGRLKQIHEQIRVKNEKVCELKAKI